MRNHTLLTDLYQLTMMYGYYKCGMQDNRAVFDMFYRRQSETMNYAIAAGLEQLIEYRRGPSSFPPNLLCACARR